MGGTKHDNGKAPMELLSHQALLQIAEVFGAGAAKYGRYNYKAGIGWSRLIGAAYRHLGAFNSGENLDAETGKSHIAHLGCCVAMLLDMIKEHPELDDRYCSSDVSAASKPQILINPGAQANSVITYSSEGHLAASDTSVKSRLADLFRK